MVFVCDVERRPVRADGETLRIGSRGVSRDTIARVYVPSLYAVRVACRDVEGPTVGRKAHAARPGSGCEMPLDPAGSAVENCDLISPFVRHEYHVRRRRLARAARLKGERANSEKVERTNDAVLPNER